MAEDSQTPAASEVTVVPTNLDAPADASSQQSNDDSAPEPLDTSAEKAEISTAQERAEQQAALEVLRRATGHIPEHARRLAKVEEALASRGDNTALEARWNGLIDSLADFLPAGASDKLRIDPNAGAADSRVAALEAEIEKLKNPEQPEADVLDPQIAKLEAGWKTTEGIVRQRAADMGLTPEELPPLNEWTEVFNADPQSPAAGLDAMMAKVAARVAAKARRGERTDAASGGPAGTQTTRKGGLTREMMRRPTYNPDDYTIEERNAALMAP